VPAIETCKADIVVQADADVWTDGLAAAVNAVKSGAAWAIPHGMVRRLSQEGTMATIAGFAWQDQPVAQRPYRGVPGGGIVVASRAVLDAVPLDRRFIGWGQDDEAHALALNALVGEPWRGQAELIHLWHPPQSRMTRRRGSRESWALRSRYAAAKDDPAAMSALIEESRVDQSPDEHASDAAASYSNR
jgi:hypothetical protein